MTWQELLAQRKVESRHPARAELLELRALAAREISDAGTRGPSPEGKFEHAYAAARALAALVIRAEGYRVISGGGHYYTFIALEAADPAEFQRYSVYFDLCRSKRNEMSYLHASVTSDAEIKEILRIVPEFAEKIDVWLKARHPDLVD